MLSVLDKLKKKTKLSQIKKESSEFCFHKVKQLYATERKKQPQNLLSALIAYVYMY